MHTMYQTVMHQQLDRLIPPQQGRCGTKSAGGVKPLLWKPPPKLFEQVGANWPMYMHCQFGTEAIHIPGPISSPDIFSGSRPVAGDSPNCVEISAHFGCNLICALCWCPGGRFAGKETMKPDRRVLHPSEVRRQGARRPGRVCSQSLTGLIPSLYACELVETVTANKS